MTMTVPVWVLLAFAVWTMLVLMMTVGIYRWSMIFTGRAGVTDFSADGDEGAPLYRRAMRAHLNCLESLPVYGAIVLAIVVSGAGSSTLDTLALVLIGARIAQTLVHVLFVQGSFISYLRFGLFFTQLICMLWMTVLVVQHGT
jgi:uncharacterized MAPEG superfamily protein